MFYEKLLTYLVFVMVIFSTVVAESSRFRILAPEIVCPKDENSIIDKPDNIIITIHTEAEDLKLFWTVRWVPLAAPTQRFTLLLWRTVRALEAQLNGPQPEPFNYVIENADLLKGVEYIFNVTSIEESPSKNTTKSFHIDNIKGDQKLILDGRSHKFSVYLVGGDYVYTDMVYVLEAEVTTCSPYSDYHFVWNVVSSSGEVVNVTDIMGWRLTIPPYSLQPGEIYYVYCQIYQNSTILVAQTDLSFRVWFRGLKVYLNVDTIYVTVNSPFIIETYVDNRDYYNDKPRFLWTCLYENEHCMEFETVNDGVLEFTGLPECGQYTIIVQVNILDQQATANASIIIVNPTLPVIYIQPLPRVINDKSSLTLVANASNVTPSCTLTWYFASEQYLLSLPDNDTCDDDCQHGEALSDAMTIYSLEENFLSELSDFSNDTEWRQVSVELTARAGRARFVAQCGCSLTFSCRTKGMVYGEINFDINEPPSVEEIKISPETGVAMETVFHVTKPPASDPDKPLLYTLWCSLDGSDTLVLASNLQHMAVDTFLPFVDGGTNVWVEVCDSFGACASSDVKNVLVSLGEGRTVEILLELMRGYIQRCEIMLLRRIVQSAVVTYINAAQTEPLTTFIKELLVILPSIDVDHCLSTTEDYHTLLNWLSLHGVDTASLTD